MVGEGREEECGEDFGWFGEGEGEGGGVDRRILKVGNAGRG